jgi:hypothetical protein
VWRLTRNSYASCHQINDTLESRCFGPAIPRITLHADAVPDSGRSKLGGVQVNCG